MVFWSRIYRETAEKLFWTISVIRDFCLFSDLVNLKCLLYSPVLNLFIGVFLQILYFPKA